MSEWREKLRRGAGECGSVREDGGGQVICPMMSRYVTADFIGRMAQYSPEQLGFLDEVSKDERTAFRAQGRSRKGTWAVKRGVFVRGRRFSAEGLMTINGMISNMVVEGSMTKAMFLEYLEFSVVSFMCLLVL